MLSQMLESSAELLSSIYSHPFNINLQLGKLPSQIFQFYLRQDAIYLRAFAEVLKNLALRFEHPDYSQQFTKLAEDTIQAELDLNAWFPKAHPDRFFSSTDAMAEEKIKVIEDYIEHLWNGSNSPHSIAVGVASCLPCFLTFYYLGQQMKAAPEIPNDPYLEWKKLYYDQNFVESTEALIKTAADLLSGITCNILQEVIISAFTKSIQYELDFYEAAWLQGAETTLRDANQHQSAQACS